MTFRFLRSCQHWQVDQPHLGLPSRDYYLQDRSRKDLEAYHAYMTQVRPTLPCLHLSGEYDQANMSLVGPTLLYLHPSGEYDQASMTLVGPTFIYLQPSGEYYQAIMTWVRPILLYLCTSFW